MAAATLPDNFVTSFYTLFNQLGLPIPASFPATTPPPLASVPVLIYGAGSVSGIYAVQLLHTAGYKKIIAIASERNHEYLHSIGATDAIDYRSPSLVEDISAAVGGDGKVLLAVDCIAAENTSLKTLGSVMSPLGKLAILLPLKEGGTVTNAPDQEMYGEIRPEKTPFPKGTDLVYVRTFLYQQVWAVLLFIYWCVFSHLPSFPWSLFKSLCMNQGSMLKQIDPSSVLGSIA